MRFPKETREALHKSAGKAIPIDWPAGAVEPAPGHTYTVQSSHRAAELRILVHAVDDLGERALVSIAPEPPRLLGKAGGYVTSAKGAMGVRKPIDPSPLGGPQFRPEYEPEALGAADLAAITERQALERRARILADIGGIEVAIESAEENPDLNGSLRFLRSLLLKQKARLLQIEAAS